VCQYRSSSKIATNSGISAALNTVPGAQSVRTTIAAPAEDAEAMRIVRNDRRGWFIGRPGADERR
jgi:hypothetical protein